MCFSNFHFPLEILTLIMRSPPWWGQQQLRQRVSDWEQEQEPWMHADVTCYIELESDTAGHLTGRPELTPPKLSSQGGREENGGRSREALDGTAAPLLGSG